MKIPLVLFMLLSLMSISAMQISAIEFSGNITVEDPELAGVMISYPGMEYNQQIALEDAKRIADHYADLGYYLAKVQLPESIPLPDNKIKLVYSITEGGDLQINNLEFVGNKYITTRMLVDKMLSPVNRISDLKPYLQELMEYYNNNGFYFAKVIVSEITLLENEAADIKITIEEGDYCRFTNHIIQGNETTKNKTIRQLSRLMGQENITPQMLQQAESKILSRPYIKSCSIVPIDKTTLLYTVEEGAMTAFSGIAGYSNEPSDGSRFTGYIDLDFQNLWGTDRSVGFFWENRQNQHSSIQLSYHESGWDIPVAGDIMLYRHEQDSTWIEVEYELQAYWYDLYNKLGIYLERQNIYAGSRRPITIEEAGFYKAGGFWSYISFDYEQNPQSGYSYDIKYYYIFSQTEESDSGRQAAELEWQRVYPLHQRWVGYSRFKADIIEDKQLTAFDRFEVGGAYSIRGYLEKQFSGFRIFWTNLELRYILNRDSRLAINADIGYIENKETGKQKVYSLGTGIRTATVLGQLSVDVAFPADSKGFGEFTDGIIHFGLETRF